MASRRTTTAFRFVACPGTGSTRMDTGVCPAKEVVASCEAVGITTEVSVSAPALVSRV